MKRQLRVGNCAKIFFIILLPLEPSIYLHIFLSISLLKLVRMLSFLFFSHQVSSNPLLHHHQHQNFTIFILIASCGLGIAITPRRLAANNKIIIIIIPFISLSIPPPTPRPLMSFYPDLLILLTLTSRRWARIYSPLYLYEYFHDRNDNASPSRIFPLSLLSRFISGFSFLNPAP